MVVKIGSSLLTNSGAGLDRGAIADWARQVAQLRARGVEVLWSPSGAIAEGMKRLGWSRRPRAVNELQAAAAVGQMGLVQMWESCFAELGLHTAQVLLTHEDLGDRRRYLNARTTLKALVGLGVVPVINENDTVVVDEIRFGDNDTLGALVTNLIEADALLILTDQKGLYDADPRKVPAAHLVERGRGRRSGPRAHGGRRGQRARQRRHADEGAGREARGAQRGAHRDRLGPGARAAHAAVRGRGDRHAAGRAQRRRSRRASNGSPTT